jgi:CRISPR/Cas system-associated exonuclease Cas4 (RecB family)
VFGGGTRLQHALYGLAATELLKVRTPKPRVTAGVYHFSSHKGRNERLPIPAPSRAATARVLADLRQTIVTGAFSHARKEDDCTFCDYSAACDGAVGPRAAAKLDDPTLTAFKELGSHD